mmetsp:Transcript_18909/g.30653  ORF Transcript_18909/g.30653 Transcript_18909/m.30653 type:complete len:240 (+) Transcript_18909:99-818(+)
MTSVTRGTSLHEIANGSTLPELHLTPEEIAAVKMSFLQLMAKTTVDPITGEEESGLDSVTKKAYKMDPDLTKMFFGVEATRKFEIDPRTGLRNNKHSAGGRDDIATLVATLDSLKGRTQGSSSRSVSTPPAQPGAQESPPQTTTTTTTNTTTTATKAAPHHVQKKIPGEKVQRAPSRPRRQQQTSQVPVDMKTENVPRSNAFAAVLACNARSSPVAHLGDVASNSTSFEHRLGPGVVSL